MSDMAGTTDSCPSSYRNAGNRILTNDGLTAEIRILTNDGLTAEVSLFGNFLYTFSIRSLSVIIFNTFSFRRLPVIIFILFSFRRLLL